MPDGPGALMEMPPVRELRADGSPAQPRFCQFASPCVLTAKETELAMPDFGALSLDAHGRLAASTSTDAPVAPKFKQHDLAPLERRIVSLELVG